MIGVFVSSVSLGLEATRKQIISDLQTAGYEVGAMERFGAQPQAQLLLGHRNEVRWGDQRELEDPPR